MSDWRPIALVFRGRARRSDTMNDQLHRFFENAKAAVDDSFPDFDPDVVASVTFHTDESASMYDMGLEWAAAWIEGSLKGEDDPRVVEFARNMAMSIRANKASRS